MKTCLLITFFALLLALLILPLNAFYISNELGNQQIEQDWSNAGYTDGVENIVDPAPEYIYHIEALPDSLFADPWNCINAIPNSPDAFINTTAFNQVLIALNNQNDPYLSHNYKILSIPAGVYNITGTLSLPSNLIIKGDVSGQTILRFITPQWPSIPNGPYLLNAFNMIGIANTGIEDLTIQRYCIPVTIAGVSTDGNCYFHAGLLANGNMNTGDNICIANSSNCWVTGVQSENPFRHHIILENDSLTTISGCYFKCVQNRGKGGFGYGVYLSFLAKKCLVENNIFRQNRHGIVLEDGACNNVVAYNYVREGSGIQELPDENIELAHIHNNYGDINLHGHIDGIPQTSAKLPPSFRQTSLKI